MKKTLLLASLLLSCSILGAKQPEWKPAGDNIRTEWASSVTPASVHPEYPRPQLVRKGWKSLNGLWDYAITASSEESMAAPDGSILVPFCVESSLSGVGRRFTPEDALWYKKSFRLPFGWRRGGKKVLLHFDAVDWDSSVWVNGQFVGRHTGGYTAFAFDITPYLKKGRQEVVVKVLDATDNDKQPRGKQVLNPRSIWYTAVSGIWQSVWLERVPAQGYIKDYKVEGNASEGSVAVTPLCADASEGDVVLVELLEGAVGYNPEKPSGTVLASVEVPAGEKAVLKAPDARLWSPEDPYLYGVRMSLLRGKKVLDRVQAYTAIRSIGIVADARGHNRMALNGEALFHYGPLDQGWWPDGLYTSPSDEALRFDIEKTREMGYNMIRKHIKVEPSRWYYWCDVLGIMVWQDMPSISDHHLNIWGQDTNAFDTGTDFPFEQAEKDTYYKEWSEIIRQLEKFQCIVSWVPFNEAWAQFDTPAVVDFTRDLDGSRLINAASGGNWISGHIGDILDSHHYPTPKMRVWDDTMVNVLGEYGGIGLPVEGHLWQKDRNWGYATFDSFEQVTAKYEEFAKQLESIARDGCAGAVYTQTTDVEIEVNGLMTYDRKVVKMDPQRIAAANKAVIEAAKEY